MSEQRETQDQGALVPPLASILTASQKGDALRLQEQYQTSRRVTNRSSSILSHASMTSQGQGQANEEMTDLFWNMWQTPEEVSGQAPTNWSNHLALMTEQMSAPQRMNEYYCSSRTLQSSSRFSMQQRPDVLHTQDYGCTSAPPSTHAWNNTAPAPFSQVPSERDAVCKEAHLHHVVGNPQAFSDLASFWRGA